MTALIEQLEAIHDDCRGIDDAQQLFRHIAGFATRIGFDYCCYGFRSPRSATQSSVHIFDTYPDGWVSHYYAQNYIEIDPTVAVGTQEDRLIVWKEAGQPAADALWHDAGEFGLNHGVARSSWGPHGEFGLLSFGRQHDVITPAEIAALEIGARVLANYTHESMSRILRPRERPFDFASLSTREREVLLWTAEGKTADEIGDILGISARTVNFHVANCLDKTGCRNKVQAAIRYVMWR